MALTHAQKEQILERYADALSRAQVLIWCHQGGLTVSQISDFRRQLRSAGAEAIVVKNTLMRMALERAGLPYDETMMSGPCLVTLVNDDIPAVSKVVVDFVRDHDAVYQVKGGIVGGQLANSEQIRSLTMLPSREVLLARVVGGVQAPISGFVGVLAGMVRSIMNVLNARVQQLESASS